MARPKILYFLNTVGSAGNNFFGVMQDGGSAPSPVVSSAGFNPGKTAVTTPYYRGRWGANGKATVASASSWIAGTSGPTAGTGTAATTAGDSFVTPTAYSGTFAAGAWTLALSMRPNLITLTGRLRMRVWASQNADGTSARELTSGALVGQINTQNSTSTTYAAGLTWSPGAITLDNEYLFFQIEWQETTAGTSNSSATGLYLGSTAAITTTDFSLGGIDGTLDGTEDTADDTSIDGLVGLIGTLVETETALDDASIDGLVGLIGTLTETEPADVADFDGGVEWRGTLGALEPADDASFDGTAAFLGIEGTLVKALGVLTSTSDADVLNSGTLVALEAVDDPTFAGNVPIQGTVSQTLAAATILADGDVPTQGTASPTLGAISITGFGIVAEPNLKCVPAKRFSEFSIPGSVADSQRQFKRGARCAAGCD